MYRKSHTPCPETQHSNLGCILQLQDGEFGLGAGPDEQSWQGSHWQAGKEKHEEMQQKKRQQEDTGKMKGREVVKKVTQQLTTSWTEPGGLQVVSKVSLPSTSRFW
jgi:hypothetical protein